MATDSMEVKFREIEAVIAGGQGEGIANRLQERESGNFSEDQNIEGPKMGVLDDDHIVVSKKIHKFYFVKFWPYKDTEEKSEVEKAEEFIQKMDRERILIYKSYWTKQLQLEYAYSQLSRLRTKSRNLQSAINWSLSSILNDFEEALDKLNSKRGSSQTIHRRILHGSSMKLVSERELLKQISTPRNQLQHDADIPSGHCHLTHFKERLNEFVKWFIKGRERKSRYKNFLKDLKRLEDKTERNLSMFSVKGRLWDPWTSRTTLQEYIILIKNLLEEMEKEDKEIIAEIKREEMSKETLEIREELCKLGRQLNDIYIKRQEAEDFPLIVKKRHQEANVSCNEYTTLINKAMELASKKDISAIRKLSRVEVDKFMSRWNKSKVLREMYVKRLSTSLINRQLSFDGRMKNAEDE